MTSMIPASFLFRFSIPCQYVKRIPTPNKGDLLNLPERCRVDDVTDLEDGDRPHFADVRMAWNETGIGLQVEVRGKEQLPQGDMTQLRGSDGVTLWLDTRDSRASHRASRFCHQFHFLPTGGGSNRDEPYFAQAKIHRALHDAPLCAPDAVPFQCARTKSGWRIEAFLSGDVLNGFDVEQNRRLGFFWVVRDLELGEQLASLGAEFPWWEDPTLWSVLELQR